MFSDNRPGRHSLQIAYDSSGWNNWAWEVVHEMGHVIGLEHEHQRADSESRLCGNIPTLTNDFRGPVCQLRLHEAHRLLGGQEKGRERAPMEGFYDRRSM